MKFMKIKDFYFLSVIVLIKVISLFSSSKLKECFVQSIAFTAHQFSRNKRRLKEKNISEVLGEQLSEKQIREIVKETFSEFWQETLLSLTASRERATYKRVDIHGVEHLHNALKKGKGVILWESNSFGRRNLAKQILYENGFSIHQVHGEDHLVGFGDDDNSVTWVQSHIIKPFFEKREKQFVAEIIYLPRSDSLVFTRTLLSRLKQNAIVCVPGDGKSGQKLIPLKFLGRTELFSTGMVSLAKISGASILTMFCLQEKNGRTDLIIECPIHIETGVDKERSLENGVAQYINLLEAYIKRHPEKYLILLQKLI